MIESFQVTRYRVVGSTIEFITEDDAKAFMILQDLKEMFKTADEKTVREWPNTFAEYVSRNWRSLQKVFDKVDGSHDTTREANERKIEV